MQFSIPLFGKNPVIDFIDVESGKKYFAKITKSKSELTSWKSCKGILNTYKDCRMLYFQSVNEYLIVMDYLDGKPFYTIIEELCVDELIRLELQRDDSILNLLSSNSKKISFADFTSCSINEIYLNRIDSERANWYIIFGSKYQDIILNLSSKLKSAYNLNQSISLVYGHGDAHYQNLLVSPESTLYFIDFEVAGFMTIRQEFTKSYYLDLWGSLLYFDYKKLFNSDNYNKRVQLTNQRINIFKDLISDDTSDPFSVRDYLLMSHLFTKNPNNFDKEQLELFHKITDIILSFDI